MQYQDFDIRDFVADEDFQQWVFAPTSEQERFWARFVEEHPEKETVLAEAKNLTMQLSVAEHRRVSETTVENMWQYIEQKIDAEPTPVKSYRWLWVLVGVLILSVGSYWAWKKWSNTEGSPKTEKQEPSKPIADVEWQVIKNTNQKAIILKLDDGSTVSLEKNSQVNYPQKFTGDKREVFLIGEAFFEVEKNPAKPFLVYANGTVTKVLGTSFRIKAYKDDPQVTVSVRTGKVTVYEKSAFDAAILRGGHGEVAGMVVTPNQKVVFDCAAESLKKGIVEQPQPIVPTHSAAYSLVFEDTPASVVLKKLSEYYGIPIQFDETNFSKCPLTLTLTDESLAESLKVICLTIRAYYEEIDGQIVISGKGCQ